MRISARVRPLEKEIAKLAPQELRDLRRWFAEFDAERWDQELERDAAAGKLDLLANAAIVAQKRGEGRDF